MVLDRIFDAWFKELRLLPEFAFLGGRDAPTPPHQWFFDGHEHVDPAKEATAQATRLSSHTTTLAAEYAKAGLDWEQQLRQRAKEAALMNELGLAALQPTSPADDNDDKEPDDQEQRNAA